MKNKNIIWILALILGIFVIVFPFVSASFLKIASGMLISILGIYGLVRGIQQWDSNRAICALYSIIGIFAMVTGIVLTKNFSFFIMSSSLLSYVLGVMMIVFLIARIINGKTIRYKIFSALSLIFGLIILVFVELILDNPYYLSIIVGIALIVEAINLLLESKGNNLETIKE